jgi:CheY-like chemotaxis protein
LYPPGLAVCVVDAGEGPSALGELQGALRERAEPTLKVVLVLIGRGQRRHPRTEAEGIIRIDGNALTRQTLAKAVAIAAGRASAEPQIPADKRRTMTRPPPSREEALRQHRLILVAEDNHINQKVIQQQLNLLGYAADVAENGREALQRWRSGDYALLFTDLHMPEMDGYDLTLAIRLAESGRSRTPIIALTANALQGESEHCRAVGMDDYLSKPAPLIELGAMLEKWLPEVATDEPTAMSAPLDLSALEALIGPDQCAIQEVLRDFGGSAVRLAAELAGACVALHAADAAAVAHKLKSSARAVGAFNLAELCSAIEDAGSAGDMTALAALFPRFEAEMAAVDGYLRTSSARERHSQQCA